MSLALLSKPNLSASLGQTTGAELTLFQFDASIAENFDKTAEITDHPVEEGADTSDHIRRKPESIEIHGWVSNDPIVIGASRLDAQRTRVEDALTALERIMDEGQLVKVITSLKELDNMALSRISVRRDKDSGRILDATIRLREIIIATTETTQPPVPAPDKSTRAPEANLGRQTPTDATAAAPGSTSPSSSVLLGIIGGG